MSVRVTRTRPAHWPAPEDVPGAYPTPFGVLTIDAKGATRLEKENQ